MKWFKKEKKKGQFDDLFEALRELTKKLREYNEELKKIAHSGESNVRIDK